MNSLIKKIRNNNLYFIMEVPLDNCNQERIEDNTLPDEFVKENKKSFESFISFKHNLSTANTEVDENETRNICIGNLHHTGSELRKLYMDKLESLSNRTPNERFNCQYNSISIFDWDDTLLPTSYLAMNTYFSQPENPMPLEIKEIFSKMEFAIMRILTLAIQQGDTYIITNGAPGWVEYATNMYYPCLGNTLKNVTIISARGLFEKKYPDNQRMWKIATFKEVRKCYPDIITNIMCIGDSFLEIEAAKHMALEFKEAFLKNIKMKERPRPEHITKQLMLICDNFTNLYGSAKNLFISFEKKIKDLTI